MRILEFKHNNQVLSLDDFDGQRSQYELLYKWLTNPDVLQYYSGRDKNFTFDEIKAKYGKKIDLPSVYPAIIKIDEEPIGYLQFFKITDGGDCTYTQYRIDYSEDMYAIDLFIGETRYWGQGIGSKLLNELAKYLINTKKTSRILIDPLIGNERAIKSYEKAGFVKVKILKDYEIFEGVMSDCLLMEYKGRIDNVKKFSQDNI